MSRCSPSTIKKRSRSPGGLALPPSILPAYCSTAAMVLGKLCWLQVLVVLPTFVNSDDNPQHHHHHHHRHHHRDVHNSSVAQVATHHSSGLPTAPAQEPRPQQAAHPRRHARMVAAPQATGSTVSSVDITHGVQASDEQIVQKIKHLEKELGSKEHDATS